MNTSSRSIYQTISQLLASLGTSAAFAARFAVKADP